jgi:response regulator RpfG family c-di-GMP phosphodiesterase
MVVTDDVLIRGGGLPADGSKALWRHSQQGFDILRKTNDIAADAAQIALQHHLRFDGRGFPGAVKGKAIHEYARITVIADFFGYMISDSRYRRGLLPNEAGEILQIFADTIVDGEILGLFLKHCKLDSSSA